MTPSNPTPEERVAQLEQLLHSLRFMLYDCMDRETRWVVQAASEGRPFTQPRTYK